MSKTHDRTVIGLFEGGPLAGVEAMYLSQDVLESGWFDVDDAEHHGAYQRDWSTPNGHAWRWQPRV